MNPRRRFTHYLLAAVLTTLAGGSLRTAAQPPVLTVNPYEGVRWEAALSARANLHTHTTQSDGRMTPHEVIDAYRGKGYRILALTDHNRVTWPWTEITRFEKPKRDYAVSEAAYEDRDPVQLGMLAVVGNELSQHHHTGAFFVSFNNPRTREHDRSLHELAEAGGLAMLYHPGQYWKPAEDTGDVPEDTLEEYLHLYRTHNHLFGMEVINAGNRYPHDRMLWDRMLENLMPDRPVWGYSNDDMHFEGQLGRDWSVFLLDRLDEESLKQALRTGRSWFSTISTSEQNLRDEKTTPFIRSIRHDPARGTISIAATSGGQPLPDDRIQWISAGRTIATGPVLQYRTVEGLANYVRAELTGDGGTTYTQPFGFRRP